MNCIRVPGAPSHTEIENFPQTRPWKPSPANDNRRGGRGAAFDRLPKNCSLLTSFPPWPSRIMWLSQLCPALAEVMENFAELMQRLLELSHFGLMAEPTTL